MRARACSVAVAQWFTHTLMTTKDGGSIPVRSTFFFFFFVFFLSGQILWMSGQMQLCPDIVSGQLLFPSTSPGTCNVLLCTLFNPFATHTC